MDERAGADDDFNVGAAKFKCGLVAEAAVPAGNESDFLRHGGYFLLFAFDSWDGGKGARVERRGPGADTQGQGNEVAGDAGV